MSGGLNVLALREDDVFKFLACQTHVGSVNSDFQMRRYIYGRRPDGVNIINLRYTWEKLLLAARAIAAIENPADICVVSARPYAQRAVLKFAAHTGSTPVVGRFTPGCFTNQIQKQFKEPRLLIVSDSRVDHQAISEASHVCLPVIAFCNTDSPLRFVDVTIPCNNKGAHSIGLLWWMLAREVLYMKGKMTRQTGFILEGKEIMPDLYFYRDPEEQEKEEVAETVEKEAWNVAPQVEPRMEEFQAIVADSTQGKLGLPSVPLVEDWAQETAKWDPKPEAASGAQEWGASFQSSWYVDGIHIVDGPSCVDRCCTDLAQHTIWIFEFTKRYKEKCLLPLIYCIRILKNHAQSVVVCVGCNTVLCQPTGGKAHLTEGCSFRKKPL